MVRTRGKGGQKTPHLAKFFWICHGLSNPVSTKCNFTKDTKEGDSSTLPELRMNTFQGERWWLIVFINLPGPQGAQVSEMSVGKKYWQVSVWMSVELCSIPVMSWSMLAQK